MDTRLKVKRPAPISWCRLVLRAALLGLQDHAYYKYLLPPSFEGLVGMPPSSPINHVSYRGHHEAGLAPALWGSCVPARRGRGAEHPELTVAHCIPHLCCPFEP